MPKDVSGRLICVGHEVELVDGRLVASKGIGPHLVTSMSACGRWVRLNGEETGNGGDMMRVINPAPVVQPAPDAVNRPNHYARFKIEPITFIMANDLPFCVGNVVKYVLRYDAKDGKQDLLKARRYIDMILEDMDRKEKGTVGDAAGKPL